MTGVLIVGAGAGGAAAALFAARRGHAVTVLDRDADPGIDPADGVARPGTPQARQGHVFLARTTAILRAHAPDVLDGLLAAGAREVELAGERPGALICRRPVFESALRTALEREPGVTFLRGLDALDVVLDGGTRHGVPRVLGVRTPEGELTADLVVDASGRRSRFPRWLARAGTRPLPDETHACGFFYLSRLYRLLPGAAFPSTAVPIVAPMDYITVLAFPGDNGRFQLSVAVAAEDPVRHRLRDPEVFDRFLASVPSSRPWIEVGEPLTEPVPMAGIENRRRRVVDGAGPVAAGLVLLADAALQTNPTTGRGVSLALVHAEALAAAVEGIAAEPVAGVARFEADIEATLGALYRSQLAIDAARLAQLRAGLRRGRSAPPQDPTNRLVAAIATLRASDPAVARAAARLYNLLTTPRDVLADPAVRRPVLRYLRDHPVIDLRPPGGPDRAAFERLVA